MYERGHSIGFGETLSRMKRNVLGCMAIGLLGLVVTSAIPAYSDGQPGPLPYHTIQMADPTFEKQLARMLGESPVEQDYLPVCQTESTLLFVDDSAAGGTNDGSSWENAYTDLQTGLTYIQQHSVPDEQGETPSWEAWVAEGTYRPTQDGDREKSFPFGHCTKAYGGFTGNEAERHQRDPRAHETILTGEIGDPAQTEDNADIIISVAPFTTPETIIDGFTVRDAYSDRFLHGAVFMTLAGPVLQNNVFTHNTSLDGGVINLNGALPFIANSQFKDNTVQAVIYGSNGTPSTIPGYTFAFVNSVITENDGRCFSLFDGFNQSFMVNSFCIYNTSQDEAVRNTFVFAAINSGIWGNTVPEVFDSDPGYEAVAIHSLIQGGYEGPGNIAVDPGFTDGVGHVPFYSPVVDAGTDTILARDVGDIDGDGDVSEIFPVDAEYMPRIQETIDIGPYEQGVYRKSIPNLLNQREEKDYLPLIQNP